VGGVGSVGGFDLVALRLGVEVLRYPQQRRGEPRRTSFVIETVKNEMEPCVADHRKEETVLCVSGIG
jgi:hypothetical protein